MAVFQLGPILKARREELGLSQEDLADGICAVPTLSRIENGERMPTKNHFEMLMQRLGYSAMSLDFFTDKKDFLIYELKFKTRQAYIEKNMSAAGKHLADLKALLDKPSKIDKQFVLLYEIMLNEGEYSNAEMLEKFEVAIKLTCPKYDSNYVPRVLSYDEIILLNNIAICYDISGDRKRAISIFIVLKEYYDHHVISIEEALRTQPMILYNLSKYLGLGGYYDECIEICDQRIRIARTTGRCPLLGETLFNRAWALIQRNRTGDKEVAERTLRHAIYFSSAMENQQLTENMKNFYKETFGKPILM